MIYLPEINPAIISLGPIRPTWYGLMYVIGFSLGYLLAKKRLAKFEHFSLPILQSLFSYTILGVILGGRIGYVLFYQWDYFIAHPFYLFEIYHGGMSFHGGLIGVTLAGILFARKHQLSILEVGDFLAPIIPIGLFFGRIGNFINAELWGKPSQLPWAVVFPKSDGIARHPSQLYEALLEGIVLFVVLWCYSQKPRARGQVMGLFLLGYSLFRFMVEFVREPDAHIGYLAFGWLTKGQLLCLPMFLLGAFFLLRKKK